MPCSPLCCLPVGRLFLLHQARCRAQFPLVLGHSNDSSPFLPSPWPARLLPARPAPWSGGTAEGSQQKGSRRAAEPSPRPSSLYNCLDGMSCWVTAHPGEVSSPPKCVHEGLVPVSPQHPEQRSLTAQSRPRLACCCRPAGSHGPEPL